MRATYRISEQDYVDASALAAKLSPRMSLALGVAALALALLSVYGSPTSRGGALGALIGGIVVVIGRLFASPLRARRHYRKYKAIQQDLAVELVETGIRFFTPTGEGIVTWKHIYKWRQNATFVLIYPMPRLVHIIPRSVATQGFDLQALTDALAAYVGRPE